MRYVALVLLDCFDSKASLLRKLWFVNSNGTDPGIQWSKDYDCTEAIAFVYRQDHEKHMDPSVRSLVVGELATLDPYAMDDEGPCPMCDDDGAGVMFSETGACFCCDACGFQWASGTEVFYFGIDTASNWQEDVIEKTRADVIVYPTVIKYEKSRNA